MKSVIGKIFTKKTFLIVLFVSLAMLSYGKEASYQGEDYDIYLYYNQTACPGDAVFVRMIFNQTGKKTKITKEQFQSTEATLYLYLGDKLLDKADFYTLSQENTKTTYTLLAGIPLSSWWQKDNNFKLKVKYRLYGESKQELSFELPFNLEDKTFISEDIALDETSTSLKTDTSSTKVAQIDKLNSILTTIDTTGVYQTKDFALPTSSTRRTSYFADRRVYIYSNGKKSTSLHYGIDFGIPVGTDVNACANGKVVMAESRITTGWTVVIEHLPGLYSLYYHMNELNVTVGQMVQQGDLIGYSGKTGVVTGPHLHWEMRLNGSAVNPDFFTQNFTYANGDK